MSTHLCDPDRPEHEPAGCRYINGDVGESWSFCQRPIQDNGRLGKWLRSAYCDSHAGICVPASSTDKARAFERWLNRAQQYDRDRPHLGGEFTYWGGQHDENGMAASVAQGHEDLRVPTDVFVKVNKAGEFSHE